MSAGKLTPLQIQQLLAKPEKQTGLKGKTIDANQRDVLTWFKLCHKLFDEETQQLSKCDNPNCVDPNPRRNSVVAHVAGKNMCRYCFLSGWLLIPEAQEHLDV